MPSSRVGRGGLVGATLALLAWSAPARAQPPRVVGDTFTVFARSTTTRFPDVAYDPSSQAFLVVSGQGGIAARFVAADGPTGDVFDLSTEPTALSPRVTTTGAGFLACWLVEAEAAVKCRHVARGAAGPELGTVHDVSVGPGKHPESAPSVACSPDECLVTWSDMPDTDVRGRRTDTSGKPLAVSVDLGVNAGVFEAFPAVTFGPQQDEYWVAHTSEPASLKMGISVARLSVGSDTASSGELYASAGFTNYPEIAHDPVHDRFLIVSWINEGNPDVAGRLFTSNGAPLGDRFFVAATPEFEGGDGIGLTYDPGANRYLAVYQGPEPVGQAQNVWAAAIDADGTPSPQLQATTAQAKNGVYQPRVASDGQGRFLVVTVVDYQSIAGQFLVTDVAVDGGSPADAGGGGGGAGDASTGAGGVAGEPSRGEAISDDGCGCRVVRRERAPGWWLAAGMMLWARRRRARAQPQSSRGRG